MLYENTRFRIRLLSWTFSILANKPHIDLPVDKHPNPFNIHFEDFEIRGAHTIISVSCWYAAWSMLEESVVPVDSVGLVEPYQQ